MSTDKNISTDKVSKPKILSRGLGRRRTSIASVRLVSGTGIITVNNLPATTYFPSAAQTEKYNLPFKIASADKYDASVKVMGGGKVGQLDALVLGIARALAEIKTDYKTLMGTSGLLTRDSRIRQRRMVGTGGKARRRKQSPKR